MSTLNFDGVDDFMVFAAASPALKNLPNGAGTIVCMMRVNTIATFTRIPWVMRDSGLSAWYHSLGYNTGGDYEDDDGVSLCQFDTTISADSSGGDNFRIVAVDWPNAGASLERNHRSSTIASAESWTHTNSTGDNGGIRSGPSVGSIYIGADAGASNFFGGDLALIGVWAGVRFSDTDATNLWVGKKTSDWWNHPAGKPTMLIECTSTTPKDIGNDPTPFVSVSGATATGPNPTGWDFDGRGVPPVNSDPPDKYAIASGARSAL